MKLRETRKFPTKLNDIHESAFKSFNILEKVKELLKNKTSNTIILELIEDMELLGEREDWLKNKIEVKCKESSKVNFVLETTLEGSTDYNFVLPDTNIKDLVITVDDQLLKIPIIEFSNKDEILFLFINNTVYFNKQGITMPICFLNNVTGELKLFLKNRPNFDGVNIRVSYYK